MQSRSSKSFFAGFLSTTATLGIATIALLFAFLSYSFELRAYEYLLGNAFSDMAIPGIAITGITCIAISLNGAKISLTWLLVCVTGQSTWRRLALRFMRAVLIVNSTFMTLLIFSGQLVDPNAAVALEQAEQVATVRYKDARKAVVASFDTREQTLLDRIAVEQQQIDKLHYPQIGKLNGDLEIERGIGGQSFNGNRYKELLRLIEEQNAAYKSDIAALRARRSSDFYAFETERINALNAVSKKHNDGVSKLRLSDMVGSIEAQNPHMVRFVATIASFVKHEKITPQTAAVVLTVMATILIEMLPILLFSHVFRIEMPYRKEDATA